MSLRPVAVVAIALLAITMAGCGNPRHVVASTRVDAPPPGKALINFAYDYSSEKGQAIFNAKEIVFIVAPNTVHQVAVDPGTHQFFIVSPVGGLLSLPGLDSVIRIHAMSGRIYDVNLDLAFTNFTTPIPAHPGTRHQAEALRLLATLQTVGPVDRSIPEVKEREQKYARRIEKSLQLQREDPDVKATSEMQATDSRTP